MKGWRSRRKNQTKNEQKVEKNNREMDNGKTEN